MKDDILDYCIAIGADPMLVQGAGGNVSWKDGDTLWVKASGTCLADAAHKDIFVPVDLPHLARALASGDFSVLPRLRSESALRPSIETLLHALMPHPVVVHLHAVEVLAWLVRNNFRDNIMALIDSRLRWTSTGYHKPGAALAKAVSTALGSANTADVVLLQNHGVVIGGVTVAEIRRQLQVLIDRLITKPRHPITSPLYESTLTIFGCEPYVPVMEPYIHQLAIDAILFNRLSLNWALYPDHVVFLGPRPACYVSVDALCAELMQTCWQPELIFVQGVGVFTQPGFGAGKLAQLRCYYDVLSRQPEAGDIKTLDDEQIAELLNWDAERYRMQLSK